MIELLIALILSNPTSVHALSPSLEVSECMNAENPGEACGEKVNEFIETQKVWTEEQERLVTEPIAEATQAVEEVKSFWDTLLEGPLGFFVWLAALFG